MAQIIENFQICMYLTIITAVINWCYKFAPLLSVLARKYLMRSKSSIANVITLFIPDLMPSAPPPDYFPTSRMTGSDYWTVFREVSQMCSYVASCLRVVCHNRVIFETSNNHIGLGPSFFPDNIESSKNYIGLGPDNIELGDYIIILPGTSTPKLHDQLQQSFMSLLDRYISLGLCMARLLIYRKMMIRRCGWSSVKCSWLDF
jgi:hypothetical protein